MDTAMRAHRILGAMVNYQKAGSTDDWLWRLADAPLGEPIGTYRNPEKNGGVIGIFAAGLAWREDEHLVTLRYTDLSEVSLSSGKESEALLLEMRDGKRL